MVKGTVSGSSRAIKISGSSMGALDVGTTPHVDVSGASGLTLKLSFYDRYL